MTAVVSAWGCWGARCPAHRKFRVNVATTPRVAEGPGRGDGVSSRVRAAATCPVWEHGGARQLGAGGQGVQVPLDGARGVTSNAMGGGSHRSSSGRVARPLLAVPPVLRAVPRPQATSLCPHGPGEAPLCPLYRQGDWGPGRGSKGKAHLPESDLNSNQLCELGHGPRGCSGPRFPRLQHELCVSRAPTSPRARVQWVLRKRLLNERW